MTTSEADLQRLITDAAQMAGWLVFHDTDSRRNTAGFPDLVLVKPPRVAFVELKRETGRLRDEQKVWLEALELCDTLSSGVVRPSTADQLLDYLMKP